VYLLARWPGDRCVRARRHPEPAGHRARPALDLLRPPRSRPVGVGAGRAVHAGSARVRRRKRATGTRARSGPRARDQLGRLSRSHVCRAPSGVGPYPRRRRRRRQSRFHGARGGQRAPPRDRCAMGGVSRALGRLVVGRRELQARLRHDPAPLLLRRRPCRREQHRARRHPLPARGAAIHHRARVRELRLPGRAPADRLPDPGRGRTARLDLSGGPGRGNRAARPRRRAGRVRAERPLAADRGARCVHATAHGLPRFICAPRLALTSRSSARSSATGRSRRRWGSARSPRSPPAPRRPAAGSRGTRRARPPSGASRTPRSASCARR
jgi:hypothetical protein